MSTVTEYWSSEASLSSTIEGGVMSSCTTLKYRVIEFMVYTLLFSPLRVSSTWPVARFSSDAALVSVKRTVKVPEFVPEEKYTIFLSSDIPL